MLDSYIYYIFAITIPCRFMSKVFYSFILLILLVSTNTYANTYTLMDIDTCSVTIFRNDTSYYTSSPPFGVQLNASQGADYYNWTPTTGLIDPHVNNPMATINNSIQYVLEALFVDEENLVYNGDFELGNTGFTTEYTLGAKPLQEGRYGVTDNGQSVHDGFMPCIHDGNFYVGNGSMYNSLVVFQSQVSVTPNTDYYFSSEVTAIDANPTHPISQLALFQFNINNTQIGNTLRVNDSPCVWTSYGEVWNSGNNTTATITIKDLNTGQWANDFAIDNIALRKICKAYDTINIILIDPSTIPKEINLRICESDFPYTYYDSVFYGVGDYGYVFSSDGEVDSLHIVSLSTYPQYNITIYDTICHGEIYRDNGFDVSESGLYTNTFLTINGCDSIINLSLFVQPITDTIINAYICEGSVYNKYGFYETSTGTYYNTYSFGGRCDRNVGLNLTVIDVPEMSLFPEYDMLVEDYPITLDASCLGCKSYIWNTGSFSPSIEVNGKGIFRVCAYSECGYVCDSVYVYNPDVFMFLPNSFTPFQSNNDIFQIYTEKDKVELVSFEVFNRWGEKVFETKDINLGWDGRFKGKFCNSDTFAWRVLFKTKYSGDQVFSKVGQVSLIR